MSALAKIYGKHVLAGKKSIDEVPETIRDEVREYVLSIDPNFCDVPEEPIEEPIEEPTEEPIEEPTEEPTEETPVDDNSETSAEAPTPSVSGVEENPTEGEDTPVDTSEETVTEDQTVAE